MDENDNSPVFDITSDTSVDIAENTPMREKVAVVLGRDKDAGVNGLVRIKLTHTDKIFRLALKYIIWIIIMVLPGIFDSFYLFIIY